MGLSKSIERQLARVERGFAEIKSPDAKQAAVRAKLHEEARKREERYVECIHEVLDELEDGYFELVVAELNSAEWEQIDIRTYGEFGSDNGLSTLTNAVLSLAAERNRGCQAPPIIPAVLCDYFIREPLSKFIYQSSGGRLCWLSSGVKCEVCAYPLPAEPLLCGGLYGVRQKRDEPGECEVLPFKRCPICDGQVEWSTKSI